MATKLFCRHIAWKKLMADSEQGRGRVAAVKTVSDLSIHCRDMVPKGMRQCWLRRVVDNDVVNQMIWLPQAKAVEGKTVQIDGIRWTIENVYGR